MKDSKDKRLSVVSGDGKSVRYYVEGRGLTAESLAWLYERLTGKKATEEDIARSRARFAAKNPAEERDATDSGLSKGQG